MKALSVIMTALLTVFATSSAMASGFICENRQADVTVKVFNHVQPELGTRNAAIMIVSNPSVSHGRKTIATFEAKHHLLSSKSSVFSAKIDHRFKNSRRKGELLAGTNIGNTSDIILDVDFSYARPVTNGTEVEAQLIIKRRNGADIQHKMTCLRYLKN